MTMKKKDDNIILTVRYTVDDTVGFEEAARDCCNDQFDIMDGETIAFESSEHGAFELHLIHLKEQEKDCLDALSLVHDKSKLQLSYQLHRDKIRISFFTTRLTEEDIDKTVFDCFSLTDIDPKVIVGLFTDNRFHG